VTENFTTTWNLEIFLTIYHSGIKRLNLLGIISAGLSRKGRVAMPRHRRYRLRVLASVIIAELLVIALGNQAGAAPVTWSFVETSCTSLSGCQGLSLPQVVANLTLPDINSSGMYTLSSITGMETGDTDFLLIWGGAIAPIPGSPFRNQCLLGISDCNVRISFASSSDNLSISIDYLTSGSFGGDLVDVTDGVGRVASDGFMPGCGTFVSCNITGFWELVGVPEPSSLFDFGIAVTFCGLLLLSLRRFSLQ
jgi:hypothetical protein